MPPGAVPDPSARSGSTRQTPVLKHVYRDAAIVPNGRADDPIPVPQTPVRVVLCIPATFRATVSDPRNLGAQVGFEFVPAKGGYEAAPP